MATKSLYVGNLSYSSSQESLTTAFAAFGGSNARIIEGRGFAFIDVDSTQMDAAIDGMNGKSVDGRNLTVNEAKPRENSGGGSSYSGNRSQSNAPRGNRW